MSAILEVEELRKSFGGIVAVDGATFDIESGSITGLIGPNGAGKTTTFNLISGFYEPDGGTVRYDGRELQDLMAPSSDERLVWGGASGLTFGSLGGVAAFGLAGLGTAASLGVGAVGTGLGAGLYVGQEAAKQAYDGHKNSRPFMLAREGLARTFQITRELGDMTARENLMLAPQAQSGENLVNAWLRRGAVAREEADLYDRATGMLELLEIDHVADERAGNLSGGQRKLLELGRVLMLDPQLVLLDEPVAGVNPALTEKLMDRIETLRDEGYTFCIVEHDMEVIMNLSDTIVVMNEGKKLVQGPPEEIRRNQRVVDAYLGVD
ncbi:ABC transporter ATP-binding protein [Halobacteriales archaeon QS_6_71_20]|nr:MAG: ABC transporter ATP-binding protein [Halobacteriales archaeon QS_6_71_20]